nr:replicative DNA helicase [Eisenibacter elegans]
MAYLNNQLGKLPPQANEVEEAILGALMIEKDAIHVVVDLLQVESFYKPVHQEIYRAILTLFQESQPIDMLTVVQQLRKESKLDVVGGVAQITRLTAAVNSASNIEFHARIVMEQSIKRDLIKVSSEVQKNAFEDSSDVFDLLDYAQQQLFDIAENNVQKSYTDIQSALRKAIEDLENRKDIADGLTGVPSGFTELDRLTAGWQPSDLIILAARPAMGKTAFSLSVARNAAVEFQRPVAFFSLEMSTVQLTNRLLSAEAELESDKIKKGLLANHEWQQLHTRIQRLNQAKIFIDDTPALSVLELRAKARRLKSQHDIQMIIVDYLQLMTAGGTKTAGNREQEIAYISRSLKQLAKELNVPVIALSQLSRAVETRGGDKRPMLSDLRESGSIEQDADMVIFLYRPEYYDITQDESGNSTKDIGEVIVAKHRNGSLDTIPLRFVGKFTKFENLGFRSGGGPVSFGSTLSSGTLTPSSSPTVLGSKVNQPDGLPSNTNNIPPAIPPPPEDGDVPF